MYSASIIVFVLLIQIMYIYMYLFLNANVLFSFSLVASTGRLDQVFQILPEQEDSVLVGNMLSDGILVIDCESSPVNPDDHVVAEPL